MLHSVVEIVYYLSFNAKLETLRSDDGVGSEKVKKAIGLLSKTRTLHAHQTFSLHFFAVTARLRRRHSNRDV